MPVLRKLPVFPLPDVVFFPGTVLPLHVFETRYREMVKDALAADRTIAVALLRPGWEEQYAGNPACFEVATAGTIEDLETTSDGRYYFKLAGAVRVRLGEVLRDAPYRLVRAEEIPESPVDENDPEILSGKLDLLATQVCLVRELTGNDAPSLVLDERLAYAAAVNGACASLPAEAAIRQALLELNDLKERHRRAAEILDEVLQRVLALKSASGGDTGPRGAN
jgi:Lon protease-like protein